MRTATLILIIFTATAGFLGFHETGAAAELLKQIYVVAALAAFLCGFFVLVSALPHPQPQRLPARSGDSPSEPSQS